MSKYTISIRNPDPGKWHVVIFRGYGTPVAQARGDSREAALDACSMIAKADCVAILELIDEAKEDDE